MSTSRIAIAGHWAHKALDLIFPPVCAGCGQLGTVLCESCLVALPRIMGPVCPRCGQPQERSTRNCPHCRTLSPRLAQVRAPLAYQEPAATVIHKLKYDGFFALARPLAGVMARAWPEWQHTPDVLLPIPLHKRRQRKRGFNQSWLLAKYLGDELHIPAREAWLHRIRHTLPQVQLGPQERLANVQGAFAADGQKVGGLSIVLVDDVFTTGATMAAAAEALITAGARFVAGYCLARPV